MCKKLIFLISFVLVLGLGSNALADDADPPEFAGADQSAAVWWDFSVEPPDPTEYCYFLPEAEPDGVEWVIDSWQDEPWWTWNEAEGLLECADTELNFYLPIPEGDGENITLYAQVTFTGAETDVFPMLEQWNGFREGDPAGDYLGGAEGAPPDGDLDVYEAEEIAPGVWQIYYQFTMELDELATHASTLIAVTDEFGGSGIAVLHQVVLDAVVHDGDAPPVGTGERCFELIYGATNPRPTNGEQRVSPDNLELIWDKDPNALAASEHVWFSDIENDVTGRNGVSDANKGVQDPNYYPTAVYLPVELGQTYYWAIDETLDIDPCDAPGPVWSFTVIDVYASNPSPEDDANYVSPCPELKWDPGYGVVTHKLYFSDVFAEVNDRNSVCLLTPPDPCYDAGPLLDDTEYFWCVDEVNSGAVNAFGPVWSFTTGPDPVTDAPDFRDATDSFQVNWLFTSDWTGWTPPMPIWDSCSIVPPNPNFDPCCVDGPNGYEASYTVPDYATARTGKLRRVRIIGQRIAAKPKHQNKRN